MKNSRLIELLRSFSSKDQRLFGDWLASPIHNTRKDVRRLYAYFLEIGLDDKFLQKEAIWHVIFPKQPYKDAHLRQVIYHLLQATEQFLAYQTFRQDSTKVELHLMQNLRQRQASKAFGQVSKRVQKALDETTVQDYTYLCYVHELEMELFSASEEKVRTTALDLQTVSDSLDQQYFANKLKKACLLHARQTVYKVDYRPKFIEPVLQAVKAQNYHKTIPAIGVYYHCYLALTTEDKTHFEQLQHYIHRDADYFSEVELRSLYLLAINYTIKRLNAEDDYFLQQAFKLYQSGIEKKILMKNGQLSPWTYRNAATAAIRLNAHKWASQFIQEYRSSIPEAYQQTIPNECLAKLHYAKKEYQQAIQLLEGIQFKDILLQIGAKVILAKIYYEKAELDALEKLLHTLKTYLKRKEVVGYHKKNYQNIIRLMQRLVKTNLFDRVSKQALLKKIEHTHPLTERAWLQQQLT